MAGEIKFLRFSDGTTVTAPTALSIDIGALSSYVNDAAFETAKGSVGAAGDMYFNTTANLIRYHNGTAWGAIVDETTAQAQSNKTITSSTLDSSPVGATTPSTGAFSTLSTTGAATIGGDLTVNGTTTTVNSTTLDVDDANITELGTFVSSLKNITEISLLPYHRSGITKLKRLNQDQDQFTYHPPSDDLLHAIKDKLTTYGLHVQIGG